MWDAKFEISINDPEKDELVTTFFLGGIQIGLDCTFGLSGLIRGKSTFKGMPVVGGKIDFLLRALDFGTEEEKATEDDFSPFDMM